MALERDQSERIASLEKSVAKQEAELADKRASLAATEEKLASVRAATADAEARLQALLGSTSREEQAPRAHTVDGMEITAGRPSYASLPEESTTARVALGTHDQASTDQIPKAPGPAGPGTSGSLGGAKSSSRSSKWEEELATWRNLRGEQEVLVVNLVGMISRRFQI